VAFPRFLFPFVQCKHMLQRRRFHRVSCPLCVQCKNMLQHKDILSSKETNRWNSVVEKRRKGQTSLHKQHKQLTKAQGKKEVR
jgi:hypothetical protein